MRSSSSAGERIAGHRHGSTYWSPDLGATSSASYANMGNGQGERRLSTASAASEETILPADETIFAFPRNRPETVAGASSLPRIAEKATGELQMNHSIY